MKKGTRAHRPAADAGLLPEETGSDPDQNTRTAQYLDEQTALARTRTKVEQERNQREAALHDIQAENLRLQSLALRSQHAQLRTQRWHDRFRAIYQSVLSLVALSIMGVIIYAVVSAATDKSVVVYSFQVPPAFMAQGDNGTVIASEFLDHLETLQASARTSQAARSLQDAWSSNIQLQVPDVHVSLGDIRRTLHTWLGHQILINGDVVQQSRQVILTVRGTGFAARTFSGDSGDLDKLLTAAAEYVYGQAEPYLFATYLQNNGRDAESITLVRAAYVAASPEERQWLMNAWAIAYVDLNNYPKAESKFEQAIRLNPHFWIAYANLEDTQLLQGQEEAAFRTGFHFEHMAHRGTWYSAQVSPIQYEPLDFLRMDLPAAHQELLADEAAHGGQGSNTAQDAPIDAEMLARMHAYDRASMVLQTSPGAGSDPYVVAETAFVQGLMALGRKDYTQAVSDFQITKAVLAKNPTEQGNFTDPPVCYLGLALGLSGQQAAAQAALTQGGHYVDCYRFEGDVDDHAGDWARAQIDYQAAVGLTPSLPQAYESWGLALLRHHDDQGAILKFKQANLRGPHWCDPLEYWGQALAAEGDYKDAIKKYTQASKYTPGWGALELHWGEVLDKLGRHADALTHYRQARASQDLTTAEQAALSNLMGTGT